MTLASTHDGRQEGRHEGAPVMTAAWLRQRFGDDPGIDAVAARLADLPDADRVARITAAADLDEFAPDGA